MRAIPRGTIILTDRQAAAAFAGLFASREGGGALVAAFEREFAAHVGARHAIAVSSGKAALALILKALRLSDGDSVVLPAWDVPEVFSLVRGMGLEPRLADIDPATLDVSPSAAARAVGGRTRVLVATHLYGNPADLDALHELATSRGLVLVEDCAQALGARYRGRPVGTLGRAALFSFGLMKSLNTLKGGMVVTDDDEVAAGVRAGLVGRRAAGAATVLADLAKSLAVKAATARLPFALATLPAIRVAEALLPGLAAGVARMRPADYESGRLDAASVTGAMHPAQAACGREGLSRLDAHAAIRRRNARRLAAALEGAPEVTLPAATPGAEPAWTHLVIRVADRDLLAARLRRSGVDTTPGYLCAGHLLPGMGGRPGDFPVAEALARQNLYLPVGPDLDGTDMDHIAAAVKRAVAAGTERR
jgi:dTDP-4-amino-4,6-dideoxygalactose transaminase